MRKCVINAVCAGALLLAGGCASIISPLAGEWGQLSKDRNDVAVIKKGTGVMDVIAKIGKPQHIADGENVYAGWQQWDYPTGTLLVYRGEVRMVSVKARTKEVEAELAKANAKGFDFGMHYNSKEAQKADAEELEREKEELWGVRNRSKDNPYAKKADVNYALEGFSAGL